MVSPSRKVAAVRRAFTNGMIAKSFCPSTTPTCPTPKAERAAIFASRTRSAVRCLRLFRSYCGNASHETDFAGYRTKASAGATLCKRSSLTPTSRILRSERRSTLVLAASRLVICSCWAGTYLTITPGTRAPAIFQLLMASRSPRVSL